MIRFLVTAMGRSGTLWLAQLLNQDATVACHHEPLAQYDSRNYAKVYSSEMDADAVIAKRILRMDKLQQRHRDRGYAEVNSYLRYYVPALRKALPTVPIAGLVRDGRLVVRSLMARGCYQREGYPPIAPPMPMAGPFASCCWYWADTYNRLLDTGIPIVQLEALNGCYNTFDMFCKYLRVSITLEQWQKLAGKPRNVDVGNVPLDWDDEQRDTFDAIAGDVWRALGYG